MTTLVLGANGATGSCLVEQLLTRGQMVKIIVRSRHKIPESWRENDRLTIIICNVSELAESELANHMKDCNAVAICLGHNVNLKGIYGQPRKLVLDALRLLHHSIKLNSLEIPVKVLLLNSSGNSNRDLNEPISFVQKLVVGLLRIILPPHLDNEQAADYLRINIGQADPHIKWVAVRPDSLIDKERVTKYVIYPSPIRSALFNPGQTSRVNVGHFMADLVTEEMVWNKWKGQMPVIYNQESNDD